MSRHHKFDKRIKKAFNIKNIELIYASCSLLRRRQMDIALAKTFLMISETGSFKEAAERLNVTQSAISMRVKALEAALGRSLFERSKSGAKLTPAGEQFQRHASAIMRVWNHAQLEVSLADSHVDHIAVGAQLSLWEGFLLNWVLRLRHDVPQLAITGTFGSSTAMIERLIEGTLDIAVVYRAQARPGIEIEHVLDEELVLISSERTPTRKPGASYVFVNWGEEFSADHAAAYPELSLTGLQLDLGVIGINYLLSTKASGYFPLRIARPLIESGDVTLVKRARRFVYPVFAAYPEDRDQESYQPVLASLRRVADDVAHGATVS